MKLYMTSLSAWVLIIFYLPLVLFVLWKIVRKPLSTGKKSLALILFLILAYAIPLGDVTLNSIAMAQVCPSAGLHVYKTVEVEGYLTEMGDGELLNKYPYKFIEAPEHLVDGSYRWWHYEKQPDGKIVITKLTQPKSDYEFVYVDWHIDKKRSVEASGRIIRNRSSGEILAERNFFNPISGWVDRVLVYRWFGYGGREGCHGTPANGFESQVLIPKK